MTEQQITLCNIINQIHDLQSKTSSQKNYETLHRKFSRINHHFQELGLIIQNPLNEIYDETRVDCDATISGTTSENLKIVEVIKPAIYEKSSDSMRIIQRAIVVVESQNK